VVKAVGTQNAPQTISAKTEDGKLTLEEIQTLAADVGKIRNPRERAKAAQALRNAIRDAEGLSEEDQREAVRMLNQAMAKHRPGWAKSSDSVESATTTQSTVDGEKLINAPLQTAPLEAPQLRTLGARRL
jgi:hypothetical protein